MTQIKIEIKNCEQCPHFTKKRAYTGDSFDTSFHWFCQKKSKAIKKYVEWNNEDKVDVPDWCPCKIQENTNSFSFEEVSEIALDVMNMGMELRQNQLNGYGGDKTGKQILFEHLEKFKKQ